MYWRIAVFIALLLVAVVCPGETPAFRSVAKPPQDLKELNLPAHFFRLIQDRKLIDTYQSEHRRVAPGLVPTPAQVLTSRHRPNQYVRVIRADPDATILKHRETIKQNIVPLRGFRAPILKNASEPWPARLEADKLSSNERAAAALIRERLAMDGLLSTLAQAVRTLGPSAERDPDDLLEQLTKLGFPCDLLGHFHLSSNHVTNEPFRLVSHVAKRFTDGMTLDSVQTELRLVRFDFQRSNPAFGLITESGEDEVGLLRMQAGGGYRDGIVPSGNLDVIGKLIAALPNAAFLINVEQAMSGPFHWIATNTWRLRRTDHATLVVEPYPVAAWAQDNGKAGTLFNDSGTRVKLATLAPRYACMDEGISTFQPGESFLMDGLQRAGHAVVHSPLLFQGGNVMAVRDPKSGERVLLMAEGELHRNVALGLTLEQALEAFRREMRCDRAVALPDVSYHLDFDVCVRAVGSELVAFINDNDAAIRVILDLGMNTLERNGIMDTDNARAGREDLKAGRDADWLRRLTNAIHRQLVDGVFSESLSRCFVTDKADSAAGNLQCFLLAVDWLESRLPIITPTPSTVRHEYLEALRHMEQARRAQMERLRPLGWRIVPVPSMSELYRSINYLNGIHHRQGYVLPAYGGFYAPLDKAAIDVFQGVLGPEAKITPIRSAECQRQYGGVHCMAAAYPALDAR